MIKIAIKFIVTVFAEFAWFWMIKLASGVGTFWIEFTQRCHG